MIQTLCVCLLIHSKCHLYFVALMEKLLPISCTVISSTQYLSSWASVAAAPKLPRSFLESWVRRWTQRLRTPLRYSWDLTPVSTPWCVCTAAVVRASGRYREGSHQIHKFITNGFLITLTS